MGDEVSAERGLKRISWPIPLVARSGTTQVILLKTPIAERPRIQQPMARF